MKLKGVPRDVKLHGIKCYNIAARGIKHLAYCKELKKLGVVRQEFSQFDLFIKLNIKVEFVVIGMTIALRFGI